MKYLKKSDMNGLAICLVIGAVIMFALPENVYAYFREHQLVSFAAIAVIAAIIAAVIMRRKRK